MKINNFHQLDVWQKSHELVLDIYKLTNKFPKKERYRLTDQLSRSASSIPANIAEGTGRKTLQDYIRFLYNARGSLEETKYHLELAKDLSYLNSNEYEDLKQQTDQIGRMLNGLINSLQERVDKQ